MTGNFQIPSRRSEVQIKCKDKNVKILKVPLKCKDKNVRMPEIQVKCKNKMSGCQRFK
jgi:hypothetical protein